MRSRCVLPLLALATTLAAQAAPAPWLEFAGGDGPGRGKHVVFVTGDEEYRSEESMPQLARILARLGCRCTVCFAVDPKTGAIDPGVKDHIPGLEALDGADLLVLFTRFRDLPDAEMQHVVDYVESGRPIAGLRTATHAFECKVHTTFRRYDWRGGDWDGGFGRHVLGETWVAHHGEHGVQGTLGIAAPGAQGHPVLRGVDPRSVWDPADVYEVRLPQPDGCRALLLGEVLAGLRPDSGAAAQDPKAPRMPIAWTRSWRAPNGTEARVFTTTLGSAEAFTAAGTRRLLVNACLWALGLDDAITADLDVSLAGAYAPSPFGFGKHRAGVTPTMLRAAAAIGHRVLLGADGRLVQLGVDGRIEWEMPWGSIHDLHRLANGHLLVPRDGHELCEIDPATKQVVWTYDAAAQNGNAGRRVEVHAFEPLAGDRLLIAESGPARLIEIDRAGALLRAVPLVVRHPDPHRDTRLVRRLANGNVLVCHEGDGCVREYDAGTGAVVFEFAVPLFGAEPKPGHGPEAFGNQVFGALRLRSGSTLIATGNGHSLLEVDRDGKVVWALHQRDLPGIVLAWVTTLEELPDGHQVFGNCHAGPGQPVLVEIEPRSTNVVWSLDGFDRFGNSVSNALLLDAGSNR
jgi:type 1 glutamine amidotransferase